MDSKIRPVLTSRQGYINDLLRPIADPRSPLTAYQNMSSLTLSIVQSGHLTNHYLNAFSQIFSTFITRFLNLCLSGLQLANRGWVNMAGMVGQYQRNTQKGGTITIVANM